MADIKISELTQVSALNNGDLVEVSQVNALAPSGYTSLKASMTDLGKKVNSDIEYTTDLADFTDKTTLGAIKETAKDKNVADEYDDTQTYDKGDVVIYKNTLYICTTNNTTGTWDATKWTATTVQSLIGSLSALTTSVTSSLVGAMNEVNRTKADEHTIENVVLTSPRCPISSLSNTTAYGSGKIIYYASKIEFGATGESTFAYLTCSLFANVDYVMGYMYDNDNDRYYSIGKGNSTSLWVFSASANRTPANTFAGKQNIYINLIGIKF